MTYQRIDAERRCEVCCGPITPKNRTGICTRNKACRSALQRKITSGRQNGAENGDPKNSRWLLPTVYDLDTGEEIIDQVAIDVAVEGLRHVGLTETERKIVVERMIKGAWGVSEIARHCGTIPARIEPVINELGYEVVTATRANGKRRTASIRVKDVEEVQSDLASEMDGKEGVDGPARRTRNAVASAHISRHSTDLREGLFSG